MAMFLGLIGFFGMILFAILALVSLVRKDGTFKKKSIITGICFVIFILGVSFYPLAEESAPKEEVKALTAEEKQAVADEKKAKAEAEAEAAKIEEEEKAEAQRIADEEAAAKKIADAKAAEAEAKKEAEAKEAKIKEAAEAVKVLKAAEAAKKENAQTIDYPQLQKNPDRYAGEYVKYTGQIIQIIEGDDITNIRLAVTQDSYGYNMSDLVYVEYAGLTEFVQDDIVTVYAEVYGNYSYTSQAGYEISLPGLIADEITQ